MTMTDTISAGTDRPRRRRPPSGGRLARLVVVFCAALLAAAYGLRVVSPHNRAPAGRRNVPAAVDKDLDRIEALGRRLTGGSLDIVVGARTTWPDDYQPSIKGDVVTLPWGPAQHDRDAQLLAWYGVMEVLVTHSIAPPHQANAAALAAALRPLSDGGDGSGIAVAGVARVLWVESYTYRAIAADDVFRGERPYLSLAEYAASALTVLRLFPAEYAGRVGALSAAQTRHVELFENVLASLPGTASARAALQEAVPALTGRGVTCGCERR